MSLPDEYYTALNGLKNFRKKIFDMIVSGRIKAVLDANHETLEKYRSIIEGFSVTPYMFDVIRRKALALRFGTTDIGAGKISVLKSRYVAGKADYPIQSPPVVPIRSLPQVDYFVYTPPTNIDFIEKSSERLWGSLFVLQCNKNMFKEVADVENVSYDFYMLRPVGRGRFKADLLYPQSGFDNWQSIDGEMVILQAGLTPQGSNLTLDYFIFVFVDGNVVTSAGDVNVIPLVIVIPHSTAGNPEVTVVCGGKRILSTDEGVFCGWVAEGQFVGFTKTHGGHAPVSYDELWSGTSVFNLWVNDPSMGTTDPPPNKYVKKTTDLTTVTALPQSGYIVKEWDLDGVSFPPNSTFTLYHFRDHSLGCIFRKGGVVTIRPNANGDVIENDPYGASHNWDCVDDEYSDGDATHVRPTRYAGFKTDLYHMTDISLPSGAVIDCLTLAMRVRWVKEILLPVSARLKFKTHGTVYNGSFVQVEDAWKLVTWKLEKNPYTNQPWTQSEINDLQVGVELELKIEKVTGYGSCAICTQVYGDVEWHS